MAIVYHNGFLYNSEVSAIQAMSHHAHLAAGNIFGVYFPVENLIELWQARNYYQQIESQLTHIESLTMGTLERGEINHNPDAMHYYAARITTKEGLVLTLNFCSKTWSLIISATDENCADVAIAVYNNKFACDQCGTINDHPRDHDSKPQGVQFISDGLWKFTSKQRNELAVILEVLTFKPYAAWKLAVDLAHARQCIAQEGNKQQIAQAYTMAPEKTSCDLFMPLPPMPKSKA